MNLVLLLLATVQTARAEYTFTTLAGESLAAGTADGTGNTARFNYPTGVAVDSNGNVYVADQYNSTIRKITSGGVATTFAGLAGNSGATDGTGSAARFNYPIGVAVDDAGNVYVADRANHTIRKITSGGVATTLAGLAGNSGATDGTGSAARFTFPTGVTVDSTGNVFVADRDNHTIRKITSNGVASTLAGLAGSYGSNDGTGSAARFYFPTGVSVDATGNVYVADQNNGTIRKITSDGVVTTVAGAAGTIGATDGAGSAARFFFPTGVAVDGAGNVYIADRENHTLRKMTSGGVVTTVAGTAGSPGVADGTGSTARFSYPFSVAVGQAGNLYVADTFNQTIRWGVSILITLPTDYNGDGTSDVLWRNANTGDTRTWLSAGGSIGFGREGDGWTIISSGDFDGDGFAEPLWRNANTGEIRTWLLGGGSIGFGSEGGGWSIIPTGTGDFDGDGRSEPLWRNTNTGAIRTWLSAGGSLGFGSEGGGWTVISSGDFDGDTFSEPLWRNTSTGAIRTWYLAGGSLTLGLEGGGWAVIPTATGDYAGDGRSEPLWHNASTGEIRVWFTGGSSVGFGNEGGGWTAFSTGDFDGDGRAEPLWRNSNTGVVYSWFSAGGGAGLGVEGGGWVVIY